MIRCLFHYTTSRKKTHFLVVFLFLPSQESGGAQKYIPEPLATISYNIARRSICLLFRKSCQHQRRSQRPEHATSHAKLQFREYQQERSESRKAAAASRNSRPGSVLPFPVGLARIPSRRAKYFTLCCCCCCCCCLHTVASLLASLARATHSTPCCCCCCGDKVPTRPGPPQP